MSNHENRHIAENHWSLCPGNIHHNKHSISATFWSVGNEWKRVQFAETVGESYPEIPTEIDCEYKHDTQVSMTKAKR